ncbi:5'-nucleotidase [Arthrobacter sp. NamB2]|uniref:5'-nucleotidase n=1 Tax=Arthrobacter sp. NamB2 TaxID=2576035 RepID=UPI001CB92D59|nr:5'-nucleotidase [Arthrobacter sp. NamB2]
MTTGRPGSDSHGVRVNDAFFLGGVEKAKVLRVLKPHIFFDDRLGHLEGAADEIPRSMRGSSLSE